MPSWFTPLLLALDALAVFRLAWLVTEDEVPFGTLRARLVEQKPTGYLTSLITCPWCVSMWISPPVLLAHSLLPGVWPFVTAALAFSAVAGLLAVWAQ